MNSSTETLALRRSKKGGRFEEEDCYFWRVKDRKVEVDWTSKDSACWEVKATRSCERRVKRVWGEIKTYWDRNKRYCQVDWGNGIRDWREKIKNSRVWASKGKWVLLL